MAGAKGRSGRPANTSHDEIAAAADALFKDKGYAATSVADIAAAVGIARRTYFSYFATKSDAFWWYDEKDHATAERALAEAPSDDDTPPLQQVIDIAMKAPSWLNSSKEEARARYLMIEQNAELQIGAMRSQRRWLGLIGDHLRRRIGVTRADLLPEVIASALIGVAQAALVRWAYSDDERSLTQLFDDNVSTVRRAFEESVSDQLLH